MNTPSLFKKNFDQFVCWFLIDDSVILTQKIYVSNRQLKKILQPKADLYPVNLDGTCAILKKKKQNIKLSRF